MTPIITSQNCWVFKHKLLCIKKITFITAIPEKKCWGGRVSQCGCEKFQLGRGVGSTGWYFDLGGWVCFDIIS